MNNIDTYTKFFFTFENPLFVALIISVLVIGVVILVFIKVIFPLQKSFIIEQQKYLLEKAELMALFAEMDPDPLIRIDSQGIIIHTNEASKKIFQDIVNEKKSIDEILPDLMNRTNFGEVPSIENVGERIYSVLVRPQLDNKFTNIYMHDITQIKNYEYTLETYKGRLKSFAERLDSENEQLKKTLSSELHDNIGQLLILVKLKLANMEKHHASEIELDVDSVYHKIREISKNLRPLEFNDERLKMAVGNLVQTISANSNITGSFDFLGEDVITEPKIGLCIYRVVQEALNNIIKHSKATEFSIQIGNYIDKINVVVSDNGVGIPSEYYSSKEFKNYGTGLFSMKERIENLGGNLKINSFPQEGTTLFIDFYKRGN
ncbi:MAG: ATP-binding protein [Ignavibacteria bacterium]|nr:ATP-binding protein [Ignavibacteria bacterium]